MTNQEYLVLRKKLDDYNQKMEELYPKTSCFTPEMIDNIVKAANILTPPTNEERSQVEVYEWLNSPPTKYFLYINEKKEVATTWMGDELGKVVFKSNARTKVPIVIYGTNKKKYKGFYYKEAGDYARVTLV